MQAKADEQGWRQRALVPVLVFIGTVVAVISSLGAPMIPTVAAVNHVSLSDAQWSLTITMLVGAVATPVMGRLGDGPRRRAVMLGAAAAVLVGSVLAALPLGFGYLIVGRAMQGVGLGLTPLAIATARDTVAGERSRSAVAMLSITAVAGVGLGYPLTGLIAQSFSVHAAFWFGAVISGTALIAGAVVLPSTSHREPQRLDVLGAILLGLGIAGLLVVLSEGERWGWTAPRSLGLVAGAAVLLVWWIVHELRTEHPLVNLGSLRHRVVLTADVTAVVAGVGMYLLMSLAIRFVQTPAVAGYGFGASVTVAGLVLLPFSLASVVTSKIVPVLARRTSTAAILPIGCAVSLAAIIIFLFAHDHLWEMLVVLAVAGLGVGCTFAVMPGLIVGATPAEETGSAVSFNQVLRYIGYSTGSATSGAVLQSYTAPGHMLPSLDGYRTAALIGCVAWVVTGVITLVLLRRPSAATTDESVVAGSMVDEELLMEESIADAVAGEDEIPVRGSAISPGA